MIRERILPDTAEEDLAGDYFFEEKTTPLEWLHYYERIVRKSHQTFRPKGLEVIETALKDYENTKARLDDTQALLWENQKRLKALEIIKKYPFVVQFIQRKQSYSDLAITMPNAEIPTKEEYELLKEVLK